jgi:hypothetical protein
MNSEDQIMEADVTKAVEIFNAMTGGFSGVGGSITDIRKRYYSLYDTAIPRPFGPGDFQNENSIVAEMAGREYQRPTRIGFGHAHHGEAERRQQGK